MSAVDAVDAGAGATRPGHRSVETRWFALRFNTTVARRVLVAVVIVTGLGFGALFIGDFHVSVGEVLDSLTGRGSGRADYVVRFLRLPRVLAAILVGAALAMSGAVFQGIVRNELVSPDIIGIQAGASTVGLVWLLTTHNVSGLPVALFVGAMGTATIIYSLSWKHGVAPDRLILVGVGVQAVLGAVVSFVIRRFPIEETIWAENLLLGTVSNASWRDVRLLAVTMAVLVPASLVASWALRAIHLGDDTARAVGVPVELVRFALIALGCCLCAVAITVAGMIGFVALMVPHTARVLAGPMSPSVMAFTGALGGLWLLGGDLLARHVIPGNLPLTVVMGAFGAPYFAVLFWRSGSRI